MPERKITKYSNLVEAIKELVSNKLADLHCGLPGEVVKYDYENQKADVQPLIKRRFSDDDVVSLPVVPNCPVIFPRTSQSYIYFPLKVGDKVWLMFADYSIDEWIASGKETDPLDTRNHDLTDAVCIPGCYDFNHPIDDLENDDDIVIKNGDIKITLKPDGSCQIVGKDGVDLITECYNLAAAGDSATVITSLGIQPLVNKSTWAAIKSKLAKVKV